MLMNADQARRWSEQFPARLRELWSGIRSFARALSSVDSEDARAAATQSFLYAVGNFKRQAPIFIPQQPAEVDEAWEAEDQVSLWGVGTLSRDVHESWKLLDDIPGIGVPTATTALSALWPSRHAIFDVLTVQAATALSGAVGKWDGPISEQMSAVTSPPGFNRASWLTWDMYQWYREDCVVATAKAAGVSPQTVERALFQVIQWQFENHRAARDESWQAYGERLASYLDIDPS